MKEKKISLEQQNVIILNILALLKKEYLKYDIILEEPEYIFKELHKLLEEYTNGVYK